MSYESFELVELGAAEVAIEATLLDTDEETFDKFVPSCAPYVEFE
jgi:hypothetical protein